jgi:hypothetical protein
MAAEDIVHGPELGDELEQEGVPRYGFGSEGSLRDRMRVRAQDMDASRTERFPVPGWAHVLEVEFSTLGWGSVRRVTERHVRLRDPATRELYTAADTLLAATVGFWEVDDSGNRAPVETSWVNLVRGVNERFPENGTPRQALLALLLADRTTRVMDLWGDWNDWNNAERTTVGEELGEDFEMTR